MKANARRLTAITLMGMLLLLVTAVSVGSAPATLPDFTLTSLADGTVIDAGSLRGKTVLVNFWATWCPPCRREIPSLIRLQEEFGSDDVVVLGIAVDKGGPGAVRTMMEAAGINYPVAMAEGGVTDDFGGVFAIPATYVYDEAGRLVSMIPGYAAHETLAGAVKAALR